MRKTYIEYKYTIHDMTSGVNHPKGKPLISVLNDEGIHGWIVCGMIRDARGKTDVYLYRKVIVEEL